MTEPKVITKPSKPRKAAVEPVEAPTAEAEPEAEMTSEEAMASLEERRARIAQALTRGLVNDWLGLDDLPPDRRPVWARETREDIAKFQTMGYRIETEYGKKFADHDAGDDRRRFGDCILMTTSMENYELIQEVEAEMRDRKKDAGIREFVERQGGFQLINESEDLSPRFETN